MKTKQPKVAGIGISSYFSGSLFNLLENSPFKPLHDQASGFGIAAELARKTQLLSEELASKVPLYGLSPSFSLHSAISANPARSHAQPVRSAMRNIGSDLASRFAHFSQVSNINTIGAFSAAMAAQRAFLEKNASIGVTPSRITAGILAASPVAPIISSWSSRLAENVLRLQRQMEQLNGIAKGYAVRGATPHLYFPNDTGDADLSDTLIPDIAEGESELPRQEYLIGKNWLPDATILIDYLIQSGRLAADAIRRLLSNQAFRIALIQGLAPFIMSVLGSYVPGIIDSYSLSSINKPTIVYRKQYLPDSQLGRIICGKRTLYNGPSKLYLPRLELREGQKVILHDEESNSWRKVSVVVDESGITLLYQGWLEESAYDTIP